LVFFSKRRQVHTSPPNPNENHHSFKGSNSLFSSLSSGFYARPFFVFFSLHCRTVATNLFSWNLFVRLTNSRISRTCTYLNCGFAPLHCVSFEHPPFPLYMHLSPSFFLVLLLLFHVVLPLFHPDNCVLFFFFSVF